MVLAAFFVGMRRIAAVLLPLVFGICLNAQERDLSKGIIFCTYNVRNYVGEDQAAPPDQRAKPKTPKEAQALFSVIRDIQPDILGVCEMGSEAMFNQFKQELGKVGLEYPHSEYVQAGDPDRHVALVSKFPITARNSQTKVVFQIDGVEHEMKRGILDVTIQVTPEYQLRCVGAHLKSKLPVPEGEALIRRHESSKMREHLDAIFKENAEANVLCYGDFNDTKNEPMFQEISGVRNTPGFMADLWAKDTLGDRWTHYWRTADQYARFDYIFVSKGAWPEVRRDTATVYRSPYWFDASDHRPVYVTVIPIETKEAKESGGR
jgi:endonuclease/exonuclease/phosphatase family metal-dependent hydrolase